MKAVARPPHIGDIYRIKRRYERVGPPFIRVFTIIPARHLMRVVDYMQDGQLAWERGWDSGGFRTGSTKLPRWFQDEPGWPKLTKYWRLVPRKRGGA
jgi:hypothetical protein